jgi:hypothetical protein
MEEHLVDMEIYGLGNHCIIIELLICLSVHTLKYNMPVDGLLNAMSLTSSLDPKGNSHPASFTSAHATTSFLRSATNS